MKKKGSPFGLMLAFALVALGIAGEQLVPGPADVHTVVSETEDRSDSVACEAEEMGCRADALP